MTDQFYVDFPVKNNRIYRISQTFLSAQQCCCRHHLIQYQYRQDNYWADSEHSEF